MLTRADRMTKFLLLANAILLATLLGKSLLTEPKTAYAASSTTSSSTATTTTSDNKVYGYRLTQVGQIAIPTTVLVKEMQVIDSSQAFIVRLNDAINVYRIDRFYIPPKEK